MTSREVMQQALEALETLMLERGSIYETAITTLREALEQPEQEPVAFYHPRTGFYWAKPTSIFAPTVVDVEPMPLYAAPPAAQPEQEPTQWRDMMVATLVREGINKHKARELADHFAAQPEPPPEWEAINNIIAEYGLQAIDFVADWKATLWQAEPVAWGVFEGNLHDMFFTQEEAQKMAQLKGTHAEVQPLYTTPPAAQPEQSLDDLVAEFESTPAGTESMRQGREWLKDLLEQEPVGYVYWSKGHAEGAIDVQTLKPGTPLYTTPPAAQPCPTCEALARTVMLDQTSHDRPRPWVGLTEEEKFEIAAEQHGWEDLLIAAEARLKEKNNG